MALDTFETDTGQAKQDSTDASIAEEVPAAQPVESRFRLPWPLQLAIVGALCAGLGGYVIHKHDSAKIPVAFVNGTVVDQKEFDRQLEADGGAGTLRDMVSEELDLQYAQSLGVLPSQKEIDNRYNELLTYPNASSLIDMAGQTEAEVKYKLLVNMAMDRVETIGTKVTEADQRKFYKHNIDPSNPQAAFYGPPTVTFSGIMTKSDAQIQKAYNALEIGNAPFAIVARKYSQDPTKYNGGQFPQVTEGRSALARFPRLEHLIFHMQVGQVAGPIKIAGGWWIIQCNDRTPAVVLPFDRVTDECFGGAAMQKVTPQRLAQVQAGFEEFQKHSIIRAMLPQYKSVLQFGK